MDSLIRAQKRLLGEEEEEDEDENESKYATQHKQKRVRFSESESENENEEEDESPPVFLSESERIEAEREFDAEADTTASSLVRQAARIQAPPPPTPRPTIRFTTSQLAQPIPPSSSNAPPPTAAAPAGAWIPVHEDVWLKEPDFSIHDDTHPEAAPDYCWRCQFSGDARNSVSSLNATMLAIDRLYRDNIGHLPFITLARMAQAMYEKDLRFGKERLTYPRPCYPIWTKRMIHMHYFTHSVSLLARIDYTLRGMEEALSILMDTMVEEEVVPAPPPVTEEDDDGVAFANSMLMQQQQPATRRKQVNDHKLNMALKLLKEIKPLREKHASLIRRNNI